MKKLLLMAFLCTAGQVAIAAPDACDQSCQDNTFAVMDGPGKFSMKVGAEDPSGVTVTLMPKDEIPTLTPVVFHGTAPMRLVDTQLQSANLTSADGCDAEVIISETKTGGKPASYLITMKNLACQ